MPSLAEVMIANADSGRPFSMLQVSRFTPEEFRTAIQSLMGEGHDALAYALGDAGLALYPDSEDILAITSLLAVMREDWPQAVDLLQQLLDVQAERATVFTHSMLIRSLRCNLDLADALTAAGYALTLFPDHPELLKEYDALASAMGLGAVQR
jgi:hypothetical protein